MERFKKEVRELPTESIIFILENQQEIYNIEEIRILKKELALRKEQEEKELARRKEFEKIKKENEEQKQKEKELEEKRSQRIKLIKQNGPCLGVFLLYFFSWAHFGIILPILFIFSTWFLRDVFVKNHKITYKDEIWEIFRTRDNTIIDYWIFPTLLFGFVLLFKDLFIKGFANFTPNTVNYIMGIVIVLEYFILLVGMIAHLVEGIGEDYAVGASLIVGILKIVSIYSYLLKGSFDMIWIMIILGIMYCIAIIPTLKYFINKYREDKKEKQRLAKEEQERKEFEEKHKCIFTDEELEDLLKYLEEAYNELEKPQKGYLELAKRKNGFYEGKIFSPWTMIDRIKRRHNIWGRYLHESPWQDEDKAKFRISFELYYHCLKWPQKVRLLKWLDADESLMDLEYAEKILNKEEEDE